MRHQRRSACERSTVPVVAKTYVCALGGKVSLFGDRNDGVVRIEMTRRGRHWRCIVSDNGIGMNGAGRGTGLNIVDALVRSLKGRLIIRSGSLGTRVYVVLPAHLMPRENEAARDAIALAEYRRRPANWLRQTSCKLTEPLPANVTDIAGVRHKS